jgi:antitoxin HicB
MSEYPFTVRPLSAEEGGGYLIEFPDLPGCMSDGETVEEAISNGEDAKRDWIAAIKEAGRPIPLPSVEPAESHSGKWQLRTPKSLHRKLAEQAQREGVSLNTLAVSFLAEGLGRSARQVQKLDLQPADRKTRRHPIRSAVSAE